MKDYFYDLSLSLLHDPRLAVTVGGSTAVTSSLELFRGGMSILAVAVGAILSVSLIIIHWKRWRRDERDAKVRLQMDVARGEKELEQLSLENRVLKIQLHGLKKEEGE